MNPVEVSMTAENRIKGMIAIRDCVRTLIEYQTEDYSDAEIQAEQVRLNELYDDFSKKYGLINARANNSAFSSDSSYCLLSSLEVLDDEGNFIRKADMFSKRTIKQKVTILSVDTASEAYALSLWDANFVSDFFTHMDGEMIANVILFLPFGLLYPFFKDSASWRRTVLAGIVCSVIIEIAQPVFGRAFDINDIILNTVGVLISATVFSFVKGIIEKRKKA